MGMKIAVLFSCLVLVGARTVTIEKAELSLTEESQDLDALTDNILQTFLSKTDVSSDGQFGDLVQSIDRMSQWKYCKKILHHISVCFHVTVEKGCIVLDVTVAHKQFLKMTIEVPNPPKVCKKVHLPVVKKLEEICVQVKDVDLKKASGCVYLSFEWNRRWFTHKVGCFKIPKIEGDIHEAEELDVVQDESVLAFEPAESVPDKENTPF